MKNSSCDIIIPVWNQLEATRQCIDSIFKNTHYPYRLIIIDNGSFRDAAEYLRKLEKEHASKIILIRNDENAGFVRAVNQGMRKSCAPYICLMNNDTIPADGWLEELVSITEVHPKVGVVNPSSNTFGQCQPCKSGENLAGQVQELYSARGFCMLIKRELLDAIGLFDEIFGTGYFEETDFSFKAQKAGFSIVRAKGSYVYHAENVSFKELKNNDEIFAANEKVFFSRWGHPVRVGYFIDRIDSVNLINEIALGVARNGHQISIFLKRGLDLPVDADHFGIRRNDLPAQFFGVASVYKVLKRKMKKRFDFILTDNYILGNFLKAISFLHKSKVRIAPRKEELLAALNEESRKLAFSKVSGGG